MIKEIADNIVKEAVEKLDSIYNWRKQEQGLVSVQNTMILSLKRKLSEWKKEQYQKADRIKEANNDGN